MRARRTMPSSQSPGRWCDRQRKSTTSVRVRRTGSDDARPPTRLAGTAQRSSASDTALNPSQISRDRHQLGPKIDGPHLTRKMSTPAISSGTFAASNARLRVASPANKATPPKTMSPTWVIPAVLASRLARAGSPAHSSIAVAARKTNGTVNVALWIWPSLDGPRWCTAARAPMTKPTSNNVTHPASPSCGVLHERCETLRAATHTNPTTITTATADQDLAWLPGRPIAKMRHFGRSDQDDRSRVFGARLGNPPGRQEQRRDPQNSSAIHPSTPACTWPSNEPLDRRVSGSPIRRPTTRTRERDQCGDPNQGVRVTNSMPIVHRSRFHWKV